MLKLVATVSSVLVSLGLAAFLPATRRSRMARRCRRPRARERAKKKGSASPGAS